MPIRKISLSKLAKSKVADSSTQFNPPKLSSSPTSKYAYVCLMMKGDKYLPGILTTIGSLAIVTHQHISPQSALRLTLNDQSVQSVDRVVMVTSDVSEEAKKEIMKVATHIAQIDYLTFETKPLATERIREMYGSWNSSAYSKWNAMGLPYEKVVFLDGDLGIFHNIDHLFQRKAPAFLFNSPFVKPCGSLPNPFLSKDLDQNDFIADEASIDPKLIEKSLKHGPLTLLSSIAILEPSKDFLPDFIKTIRKQEPFGFEKVMSGADEQSFAYYFGIHKPTVMYNIHQRYNYLVWKNKYLKKGDLPYVLHWFADKKPWTFTKQEALQYADVLTWYKLTLLVSEKFGTQLNFPAELLEWARNSEDTYAIKLYGVSNLKTILTSNIEYKKDDVEYRFIS